MNTYSLSTLTRWAAPLGLLAGFATFFLLDSNAESSAPLVFLLMAALGTLLAYKEPLSASLLLSLAGAALFVHPLMYHSSLEYVIAGLLFFSSGVINLIQWWNKE
jgi:hypothetical protein